jgi:DMSO/TMAO reductase YedYZ molybdopterin-dependent catalytic subunit
LPAAYGFPVKLYVPTEPGRKNPKHIVAVQATDVYPGGVWEDYGYNWFIGS